MRTSIDIDDALFYEAKKIALDSKQKFNTVIENALRTMIVKKNTKPKSKISLITTSGSGLNHGVDLDSNQSLADIMDD